MSQRNSTPHFLFKVLTLATTITLPLCLLTITPSTHATSKFQECSNNHNASQLIDRQSSFLDERNTGGLTLQNGQNNGNGPVNDSGLLSAPIIHKTQPELVHDEREKNLIINEKRTRDVNMWRLDFIEEEADGFELKVLDDTIDERMANLISTMLSLKAIGTDFFTFNSGSPDQDRKNMESVAGPQVDELKCHRHLKGMVSLLDDMNERLVKKRSNQSIPLRLEEKHHRLARVLDSYGRYESGHLSGRTHSIGQYDQCIHTDLLLANESSKSPSSNQLERVRSRYCWARLKMDKHLHPSLKARPKESFEPDGIMVAICLPQSCHSKTFSRNKPLIQRLVDSQFRLPRSIYTDESMEVNSVYCLIDQESKYASLPFSGKLAVISLVSWLMLTIYATAVYNPQSTAAGRNKLFSSVMDCLNLRKSIQDLVVDNESSMSSAELEKLKLQERNRTVELNVLNPVKTFGSAFVVMGHSLVVHAAVNQNGLMAYHMAMSDPQVLLIVVGTFIVDTFFVITGVLIGFIAMKRANSSSRSSTKLEKAVNEQELVTNEEKQHTSSRTTTTSQMKLFAKHWLMFAINRHLLLVPMLFLVFWFKKSVFIHYFADRPLWDAGFNKDTLLGGCKQESWFSQLTLKAVFNPSKQQCLIQSWSIAVDLFFSLTIPPVVLVMSQRPKLALAIGAALVVIGGIWAGHSFSDINCQEKIVQPNGTPRDGLIKMIEDMHHLYVFPPLRFSCVLIGLLAGYHLYRYGEKPAELRNWPDWVKRATKYSSIGLILIIIIGKLMEIKIAIPMSQSTILLTAIMYTTFRIVWAACNALLFMRMASDWQHNNLMQMFASRFWQSTAKLCYGILLIHMDLLILMKLSHSSMGYFAVHDILADFSAAYLYCLMLAAFLYVVYENPINKLVKRHVLPSIESMM
uniref:Nose resistant to fluoxetine protein 6 n=1 Tax=Aceria tosichella TaxID=561515 RepID=A0A6G1S9X3_9ACAR